MSHGKKGHVREKIGWTGVRGIGIVSTYIF
jgi:hypothetical protein